jgi:hypothetical protein
MNRMNRISEAHKGKDDRDAKKEDFGKSWKDVLFSLRTILSNPVYLFMLVAALLEAGTMITLNVFLPKIVEFHFKLPASTAAILTGQYIGTLYISVTGPEIERGGGRERVGEEGARGEGERNRDRNRDREI